MTENIFDMPYTLDYLNKSLEIVFSQAVLSISTESIPITFKGQGFVSLEDDYSLKLKMVHNFTDDDRERYFRDKTTAGKLIKKDQTYSFCGIGIDGDKKWEADEIRYHTSFDGHSIATKIQAELNKIGYRKKITKEYKEFYFEQSFLLKSMKTPKSFIDKKNKNRIDSKYEFKIGNVIVFIVLHMDHITLIVKGPLEDYSEDKIECIVEAVGICLGISIIPMVKNVFDGTYHSVTFFNATKYLSNDLPSPLYIYRLDTSSFSSFVSQYVNKIDKPNSNLYTNWFKVIDSDRNIIDNKALIQGVVIENMVETYFSEYRDQSDSEIQCIKDAISHIQKCKSINSTIKERIISSLSNWTGPSNRTGIKKLKDEGKISAAMYKAWNKTRQPLAHGSILTMGGEDKIQIVYSDMMTTLCLFYYLIFLVIGYNGRYINYSKHGYPEEFVG